MPDQLKVAMQSAEHPVALHISSQHPPHYSQTSLQVSGSLGGAENMRCLLVRRLPSWLSREEKESLLSHFGAREVVVMPSRGKMVANDINKYVHLTHCLFQRNCVFASFGNHEEAKMVRQNIFIFPVAITSIITDLWCVSLCKLLW